MRTFDYFDYYEKCPMAVKVESAVNDCGSIKSHIEKVNAILGDSMAAFVIACIAYWSEVKHYDARNQYAVFASRRIAEQFPEIKTMTENFTDDLLLNAYGFTMSAHRYLQNEFFKACFAYLKDEYSQITTWFEEQEFVYNNDNTALVPYHRNY